MLLLYSKYVWQKTMKTQFFIWECTSQLMKVRQTVLNVGRTGHDHQQEETSLPKKSNLRSKIKCTNSFSQPRMPSNPFLRFNQVFNHSMKYQWVGFSS